MKKALKITAVVALTGFALASCKKDYTCTCTDDAGTGWSSTTTLLKQKESDAESTCEATEAEWNALYPGITTQCVLAEA
jgi:hypothetical protein